MILAFNRADEVEHTLDRLADEPLHEVIVVDSGDDDTSARVRARGGSERLVQTGDIGAAARNLAAEQAEGELLLLLDDDSYPRAGSVEVLRDAFVRAPELGLAAGLVLDIDPDGRVVREDEVGTFDWFMRAGHAGPCPRRAFPPFSSPRAVAWCRRDAFLSGRRLLRPVFLHGVGGGSGHAPDRTGLGRALHAGGRLRAPEGARGTGRWQTLPAAGSQPALVLLVAVPDDGGHPADTYLLLSTSSSAGLGEFPARGLGG